ncbi:MAG: hypothetical protein RLY31_2085 [Bacteroidota bacterium]|jgi:rSAM/selenodomain-associated transferase 1
MQDALLVFIRNPVHGQVKTRLAATLGPDEALRIYQALLAHLRGVTAALPMDKYLFYSDFIADDDEWPADLFQKRLQQGADLGERMASAFAARLPHYRRVVLVGSDVPGISPDILGQAFAALAEHDFTLGGTEDGGYYLVGMRAPAPSVFTGIAWSTPAVFSQTLDAIRRLGKTCHLLPELADIDTEADWRRHGWELTG